MKPHVLQLTLLVNKIREVDPEMPAQTLAFILAAYAGDGDVTQNTVGDRLGLSSSAMARIAARTGEWEKYPSVPGLKFVTSEPDPYDRRFRKLAMTEKGKRFVEDLLKTLTKD